MACPKCAAESGFPFRAQTIPNHSMVELSLRCHECGHEWRAFFEGAQKPGTVSTRQFLSR